MSWRTWLRELWSPKEPAQHSETKAPLMERIVRENATLFALYPEQQVFLYYDPSEFQLQRIRRGVVLLHQYAFPMVTFALRSLAEQLAPLAHHGIEIHIADYYAFNGHVPGLEPMLLEHGGGYFHWVRDGQIVERRETLLSFNNMAQAITCRVFNLPAADHQSPDAAASHAPPPSG